MISNASKILLQSQEKREECLNYAMVVFMKLELEVSLDTFKLVTHVYLASQCNAFGIADA